MKGEIIIIIIIIIIIKTYIARLSSIKLFRALYIKLGDKK